MAFLVYMLTNKVNGKRYIGVTTASLDRRIKFHESSAKNKKNTYVMARAIRAYGIEAFSGEVLYEAATKEEMFIVERGLIAAHGTLAPNGYNRSLGGEGNRIGVKYGDEFGQRVSASLKAFYANNPEACAAQGRKMAGRKRSAEDKEKKAAAGRAYWESPEGQAKKAARIEKIKAWRAANPDKVAETQRKATEAAAIVVRGTKHTPERIAKSRASFAATMRLKREATDGGRDGRSH